MTVKVVKEGIVSYMRGWVINRLLKSKNPKELDEEISEIDMPF